MGDKRIYDLTKIASAPGNGVLPIDVPGSEETKGITIENFLTGICKPMGLTSRGVNIIGNYDALDSGYGYYNNISDGSGEYAPASTAGLFFRFKLNPDAHSVTFFFPSDSGEKRLWYRIKGGVCVKL